MHLIGIIRILSVFYFVFSYIKNSFEGRNKTKLKYTNSTYSGNKKLQWFAIAILFVMLSIDCTYGQVRIPFKIRNSKSTPLQKNYSINGDFSFIGNTNLTLVNYDHATNNNNNSMQYVDVDNDLNTWNSSSANLTFSNENGASTSCTNIVFAGLYWTGRSTPDGAANSPNEFTVSKNINGIPTTKEFKKRTVFLKGPNSSSYIPITADENEIYYPRTSDAFIYSAYSEVTDFVRLHGVGTYSVADIALVEGNGSGTGYSGGWGLVVIYENSRLKHRDITLFDGHAFVLNSTSNGYNVEINGFNTIQTGNVGVKLGIMASEGDVGLNGDYFQIQKNSDLSFMNLHHNLNSENNFFNSSNTNTDRNPALANNTGIDIATFSLPNENNAVIGNSQTSTNFRYGTVGDTYAIFALALAVDSYVPKVENIISIKSINEIPYSAEANALPGQEIEINVAINNLENESISDYQMVVPVPHNATFVDGSAHGVLNYESSSSNLGTIYFDATLGANGSLIWNYGTLPQSTVSNEVLANLNFKIRATEDCYLLKNAECSSTISIDGFCSGTGTISGVSFTNCLFILGKTNSGNCNGTYIKGPLYAQIDATNFVQTHCQNTDSVRNFIFCNSGNTVPISEVANYFPPESLFSNTYPVTQSSTIYSNAFPFLIEAGSTATYYAIPKNLGVDCVYTFSLTKCTEIIASTDNGITINSATGGIVFTNILANDTLNGQTVLPNQVLLSLVDSTTSGISLDGTNVVVEAGAAPGNYVITYQICDLNNAAMCAQANVNFSVVSAKIIAQNNSYNIECGTTGIIGNVLNNDTLNGAECLVQNVDIGLVSCANQNISLDVLTGNISVDEEILAGTYELQYKISPKGNPTSFDVASVYITVSDNTKPAQPLLNDIISYCSTSIVIPTTTDACSGTIIGYTNDPLYYELPGDYVVHWSFIDDSNNALQVNQNVIIKNSADSIPGYGYVDCNLDNDYSLNIDLNTFLQEGIDRNGQWTSSTNTPNLNGSVFSPYQAPTGSYDFQYMHSTANCNQIASVTIEVDNDCFVAPACNLLVHNSFSPNNDGINEVFVIENIEQTNCFPKNTVEIYNRWGVLVFKTNQYDNTTRVFKGISEGRATLNESNQLPTGTYYYILKYTDAKGKEVEDTGYVYLVM